MSEPRMLTTEAMDAQATCAIWSAIIFGIVGIIVGALAPENFFSKHLLMWSIFPAVVIVIEFALFSSIEKGGCFYLFLPLFYGTALGYTVFYTFVFWEKD